MLAKSWTFLQKSACERKLSYGESTVFSKHYRGSRVGRTFCKTKPKPPVQKEEMTVGTGSAKKKKKNKIEMGTDRHGYFTCLLPRCLVTLGEEAGNSGNVL
jgi:hypothetical protein